MKFEELQEYTRDIKNLSKRLRTLHDDIEIVKRILSANPAERPPFSFRINGLGIETCVIKIRKMACKSLKGKGVNTGLRLVYAHFEKEKRIVMVELYHKNDKE